VHDQMNGETNPRRTELSIRSNQQRAVSGRFLEMGGRMSSGSANARMRPVVI
jgi:hypothetical protein